LPKMTAPAAFSRRTTSQSAGATYPAKIFEPAVFLTPATGKMSLTERGIPWRGPRQFPAEISASAALAAARASSGMRVIKALSLGLSRSARSTTARTSSTGETFRVRTSSAASVRER